MFEFYQEYDNFAAGKESCGFVDFCKQYLTSEQLFTEDQAIFLANLIDSYVTRATGCQKRYLPDADGQFEVIEDIQEICKSVDVAVNDAVKRIAKLPEKDIKKEIERRKSFWDWLKKLILGEMRGDNIAEEMIPLLEPAQSDEVKRLFKPKDGEFEGNDITQQQTDLGILRRANAAEEYVDETKQDMSNGAIDLAEDKIPSCLRNGLVTGLLSEAEGMLKRLTALCMFCVLIERKSETGEDAQVKALAPLVALAAAKAAYETIGTQKALFHISRIEGLMEKVNALEQGNDDTEKEYV